MIPLHSPYISANDIKKVTQTLKSGWVSTSGKVIEEFEDNIKTYTGAKFCIAVSSGTAALHLSLITAGVKKNHEVIVPTISFIAPINAVRYANANPIFMDSDKFFNISSLKVLEFIKKETKFKNGNTYNIKTKKIIKAIVMVHIFGNACDIEDVIKLCKKRNIVCIEDAAEGLGSRYIKGKYRGKHVGTISEIGCISFNGNKIITTGAGGVLITNSKKIATKARYLSTQAKSNEIDYIHNDIGYNYKMPSISASLGISQLQSIDKFIEKKEKINMLYKKNFKSFSNLEIISCPDYAKSNFWLNILNFPNIYSKKYIDELTIYLIKKKIQVRPIWKLNHMQKPYINFQSYKISMAKKLYNSSICLPSSYNLSVKEINFICEEIIIFSKKTNCI